MFDEMELVMGREIEKNVELSESEYSDILGLEGMEEGGNVSIDEIPDSIDENVEVIKPKKEKKEKIIQYVDSGIDQNAYLPFMRQLEGEGKQAIAECEKTVTEANDGSGSDILQEDLQYRLLKINTDYQSKGMEVNTDTSMSLTSKELESKLAGYVTGTNHILGSTKESLSDVDHNVHSPAEAQLHTMAEQGEQDRQAEVTGRQYKEENFHKFKQGIEFSNPVANLGEDFIFSTIQQGKDETVWAGTNEIRKYVSPSLEALSIAGAKALVTNLKNELFQIEKAATKTHKLITEDKLSILDLNEPQQLKHKLADLQLSSLENKYIRKYAESVHDMVLIRGELDNKDRKVGILDEEQKKYLKSSDYFKLTNQKTNEMLLLYLKTSSNDVLKNVNVSSMSDKNIEKLIKSSERNGLQKGEIAALKLLNKQKRYRSAKIAYRNRKSLKGKVRRLMERSICYSNSDNSEMVGIRNLIYTRQILLGAYAITKFGLKTGIVSSSFASKYTGLMYLSGRVNTLRKEIEKKTTEKAKEAVAKTKIYKNSQRIHKSIQGNIDLTKSKIEKLNSVSKYRAIQKANKEYRKEAVRKMSQVKAAARSFHKKISTPVHVVTTPFRLTGTAFNAIQKIFSKVKMVILGTLGVLIVLFVVIVLIINAILNMFGTQQIAATSIILTEEENFVADITAQLKQKADAKKQEAFQIAEGSPKNPNVYISHTISEYGHPDREGNWLSGAKIIYVDQNDNQILNGMNNFKDCIVMAYVIMQGDFDSNTIARDELILDLWDMMNKEIAWEESEIYLCSMGCNTFSYHCNEKADYTKKAEEALDGVGFYGKMQPFSLQGDSNTDNCNGHSLFVCYGHKDIEIRIPIQFMEEKFMTYELPTGESYQSYVKLFEGWTDDNIEWAHSLYNTDWYELYGCDPSGGMGYTVGEGMTVDEINEIISGYGELNETRKSIVCDAMSFTGRIPYYWGGKPESRDYGENHFGIEVSADTNGRNKKGLDCSGFCGWILWRVTDVKTGMSTGTITEGMQQISMQELQPGDLGLMTAPGSSNNHVGFFVGFDENGDALWCHENSGAGNVSVNNTTCFRYYYRIF